MKCTECEYFAPLGNTDECGIGVCRCGDYWGTVSIKEVEQNGCPFQIHHHIKTCKECTHFDNDTACMTQKADDTFADQCGGFESKETAQLVNTLGTLILNGEYTREELVNFVKETIDSFNFFEENK